MEFSCIRCLHENPLFFWSKFSVCGALRHLDEAEEKGEPSPGDNNSLHDRQQPVVKRHNAAAHEETWRNKEKFKGPSGLLIQCEWKS